jgi:hypothetical protein
MKKQRWAPQKQNAKLQQNMVYNTTQHPHPHSHTLSIYTVLLLWEGGKGWGRSERRYRGNSSQKGSKIPT